MRTALIIENGEPTNLIVLPDGAKGDAMLSDTCVEITDLYPQPGLSIGWTYSNGLFVAPPVAPKTWDNIRAERDGLLTASDWTQVADAPLAASEKSAWARYRQALRDVPQEQDDSDNILWPEAP